ncbi:MAG: divalent-cation tolerance protein CutA [bacterium]|nr:divalent-cation tolerance protein CutA [bacterium]
MLTTVASAEQAAALAEALLQNRLAACVTVLPGALSNYRWKGEAFLSEPEQVLLIKTHREKLTELESFFAAHHPYECPELLAFDAAHVSEAYARWMHEQLGM